MLIEHRGIYPDRFDTPFGLGTMVWAKDCHYNCRGCFHADRHEKEIYKEDIDEIFKKIQSNPFTSGIVLGGFEWTEQYEQLIAMIEKARSLDLAVILYTHYTIEEIIAHYPALLIYKGMYLKCGEYDDTKLDPTYTSHGIQLASTNQLIYLVGDDV